MTRFTSLRGGTVGRLVAAVEAVGGEVADPAGGDALLLVRALEVARTAAAPKEVVAAAASAPVRFSRVLQRRDAVAEDGQE